MSVAGGRATWVSRAIGLTGLPRYVRGGKLIPRRDGFCVKSAPGGCTVRWETTKNNPVWGEHGFARLLLTVPDLVGLGFVVEVVHEKVHLNVGEQDVVLGSESHLFVSRPEWKEGTS